MPIVDLSPTAAKIKAYSNQKSHEMLWGELGGVPDPKYPDFDCSREGGFEPIAGLCCRSRSSSHELTRAYLTYII